MEKAPNFILFFFCIWFYLFLIWLFYINLYLIFVNLKTN